MAEGKNLNIAEDQQVTEYGEVIGMTFFGMFNYDNDGNVKAIKSGTTNIEVSVDGVIKSVKLSVKDILINSIRFSNSELTKSVGENGKLVPIITPDNATNRDYSWSSSDNSIVSIDKKESRYGKTYICWRYSSI